MNIKIRAYDKKNKCFVKDLHNIRVRKNGEIYSQNKDIEFNLFTGILDCHNIPIFEGDIIESYDTYIEVKWENYDNQQGFNIDLDNWQAEIVGNRYENSELLLIKNHELT